ncbi:short chain dehydrogenase [Lophiostoma macrostomum CBS 122681]|uniref:Short chain dehydrogenase n=1 Tax=Lophiostoma macrostomum CBS 122681 TaxID=1314788 RepID=A0A6A6T3E2_9PLEO|nr:short chain dehydrogenase [Lophiostoma macrostomum CBS 122681]
MSSEKRIILVTGASNGIGFDTTYALVATSPNNHVIMGVRNPSKGEEKLKEIQARGIQGTLSTLQLDVTSDTDIEAAVKKISSSYGRLDVLVNNAGICLTGPQTRSTLHTTFETNVYGPYLLTLALGPLLQKSSDARVINVTSGLGSIAMRTDTTNAYYQVKQSDSYRVSKAALNMVGASTAAQFDAWGCKTWSFCPGFVVTDLTGVEDRQSRRDNGAESAETSAKGIKEIVEGVRDGEVLKFIARNGEQYPW